ncbi:hypothetical protein RQP46_005313 [Phenoliferia psychrophenolica]
MATIRAIPAETLHLILKWVHVMKDNERDKDDARSRHHDALDDLASASLVARNWRKPAQSLMWSTILLSESTEVDLILESPALGRHRTKELVALGSASVSSSLGKVIMALEGQKCLSVDQNPDDSLPGWHKMDWLGCPKLKGLKHLNLRVNLEPNTQDWRPTPPHFQLASLAVGTTVSSPQVIKTILDASITTLISLKIPNIHGNLRYLFADYFSRAGGTLQQLSADPEETALLLPHASSHSSLADLSILVECSGDIRTVNELLSELPFPMITKLEVVVAPHPEHASLQLCRERKIKVTL